MAVMIGIDPHKRSHTAAALDREQRELRQLAVRAGRRQVVELLAWADAYSAADVGGRVRWRDGLSVGPAAGRRRRAGVRCAGRRWPPRVRVLAHGSVDQERPERRPLGGARRAARPGCWRRCVELITSRCVGCWPSVTPTWPVGGPRSCCRLHALVAELVPGGIAEEVVATQAHAGCSTSSTRMIRRPLSGTAKRSSSSTRSNTSTL